MEEVPDSFAANANYLFYAQTSSGTIKRMARATNVVAVLATAQEGPAALTVDNTALYWSNTSSKSLMKLNFDATVPEVLATASVTPWATAVDSVYLYWCAAARPGGLVGRIPRNGGTSFELASGADVTGCEYVAAEDDYVYWTNSGEPGEVMGRLMKAPRSGSGPVEPLIESIDAPRGLAVRDGYAYVLFKGGIHKVSVDGGAPTTLLPNSDVSTFAIDSSGVYVAFNSSLGVSHLDANGIDYTPLTEFLSRIDHVLPEGDDVFWTFKGFGTYVTSKTR